MFGKLATTLWPEGAKLETVKVYMVAPTGRFAREKTLAREFGVKFFESLPAELASTSKKVFFRDTNDAQAFQILKTGSGLYELNLPSQAITNATENSANQIEVDASKITSLSILSVTVIAIPTYAKCKIENPLLTGTDTPHVEIGSPPNPEVLKRICSLNKK